MANLSEDLQTMVGYFLVDFVNIIARYKAVPYTEYKRGT